MAVGVLLATTSCGNSASIRDTQPTSSPTTAPAPTQSVAQTTEAAVSTTSNSISISTSTSIAEPTMTEPATTVPSSPGSTTIEATTSTLPTAPLVTVSEAVPTGLVIDRSIVPQLDQLLAKSAPSAYGGVTGDDGAGTANVYVVSAADPATVVADLTAYVETARAQVAGFGPQPTYPDLHIQLIRSSTSYAAYSELYRRVTQDPWTTDASRRVSTIFTDYNHQQVVVEVLDRTDQDVAAAAATFGRAVRVEDGGSSVGTVQPADWRLAPSFAPAPDSTTLELAVSERACSSGHSADGRITANVVYSKASITVTVTVRSLGGAQTCPAPPPTPYTLHLTQPLGNRTILGATSNP